MSIENPYDRDMKFFSGKKELVRQALLKDLKYVAEMIHIYHRSRKEFTGMSFPDGRPLTFRPGMGDRLLFKRILDNGVLDNIMSEEWDEPVERITCAAILGNFYYPNYERFDREELEKNR